MSSNLAVFDNFKKYDCRLHLLHMFNAANKNIDNYGYTAAKYTHTIRVQEKVKILMHVHIGKVFHHNRIKIVRIGFSWYLADKVKCANHVNSIDILWNTVYTGYSQMLY